MYKDEEEIKIDMLNNIDNTLDKSQNSFINNSVSGAALELASFYMNLDFVREKLNVENLEGKELEDYIYQRTGLKRKLATYATTLVEIEGEEGAIINIGILVSTGDIDYEVVEESIINSTSKATVKVEAMETGSIGNAPSGAISEFPVTINGLVSVTNPSPITNGYDEENDTTYLERYYERIRTPATSGNKYHYSIWAKEVVGVGDARVVSLWDGDNTVKVIIIDSNKEPASEELIEEVQEHIDPETKGLGEGVAPIGAFCTVVSATGKAIDVNANIVTDNKNTLEDVIIMVKKNIKEYFKEVAFKESIISYAKIGSIVLSTESVIDYSDLLINNGTSNIPILDDEIATLGEVVLIE